MKKLTTLAALFLASTVNVNARATAPNPVSPKFERAYELAPKEGVFAYSRISPDGHYLAYASEMPRPGGGITQTVTIVDLERKKVIFTEAGIDAYFSIDNTRVIYSSFANGGVSMFFPATGKVLRNVAPGNLGDYYSWAKRDGRDLILTITSNYYYLESNKAVMPNGRVQPCPGVGTGDRPLISKDGMKISTFVRGTVVVRNLTDCDYTFETGLNGAKSDFSFDGRYLAMHAPRPGSTMTRGGEASAYDIMVVDLKDRTMRNITAKMTGSSYYPSYTSDGRLSFRYDGDDFHGFMFASDFLSVPAQPLPSTPQKVPPQRAWNDMFPETPRSAHAYSMVLVYGTWSAHSPIALADMQKAREYFEQNHIDIDVTTATAPGSKEADVQKLLTSHEINLPRIPLAWERAPLTEITNQSPSTLLFRDGQLIDRKLGAVSFDHIKEWVGAFGLRP